MTAPLTGAAPGVKRQAAAAKKSATTMVTEEQSPSSPSVKLTPLSVPSTTRNTKGTNKAPSGNMSPVSVFPVKGTRISL